MLKLLTFALGTLLADSFQFPLASTLIVIGPKKADVPLDVKPFAVYVPEKTIGAGAAAPPKALPVRVN
jgi:hypothetical protein